MRLQLSAWPRLASLLLVGLWSAAGQAQGATVSARSSLYQDDDATLISTSTISARGHTGGEHQVTLGARYLLDAISSASIDVVTAATSRWTEERHEVEGSLAYTDGTRSASGAYIYSGENDWWSHTLSASVSHDFLGHDLTLALGGSYVDNDVGRADDPTFSERLRVVGGSLTAVFVPDPSNLVSLAYGISHLDGFQSSPYRFVPREDPAVPEQTFWRPESHPRLRTRSSYTARWNLHLFEDTALRSHARLYHDDWGIRSLTAGTEYVVGFGDFEPALFVRGYAQRGADFYRERYDAPQRYMSADREASDFRDVFYGARLGFEKQDVGALEVLRLEARATGFAFWFSEFSRLPRRLGYIVELALRVEL